MSEEATGVTNDGGDVALEIFVFRNDSKQGKVFKLLSDKEWHCREHEGNILSPRQYAGGGGIQGLQRGSGTRPGLEIESKDAVCPTCNKKTKWDRWTGGIQSANAAAGISPRLVDKILSEYGYADVIEQRVRAKHELVIDHRFPMERWGEKESPLREDMTDEDIRAKFQLLKKDAAGNHNLLKSRACERCIATGKRGTPLGIAFWYESGEDWPVPEIRGPEAERGCIGCGWYDFAGWRDALNRKLMAGSPPDALLPPEK